MIRHDIFITIDLQLFKLWLLLSKNFNPSEVPLQTIFMCALNLKDKKPKEQEAKDDLTHPFLKKSEKGPPTYKEPSSFLTTQMQNKKSLLSDRRASHGGLPERGMCWS